jgi:glycosyltransferase involved in cell wall biosynthesis
MRIAVVEPDGAGGLAHYAFQMSAALSTAGAEVTLVTSPHWELADLERSFAVEQVINLWPAVESPVRPGPVAPVRRFWRRTRRIGRALRYAWAWERLTRFLIRMRPDIVQFSVIHFPFQSFFLHRMRRAGLNLTQVCHEFELRESQIAWIQNVDRSMARSVFGAFEIIFFHGEATAERFRKLFGEPSAEVRIIPHGNQALIAEMADSGGDLRSRYGIPSDRQVVLFFGGLRPSKGLPDLIDAFAIVRREIDARLLIVGFPTTAFNPEDLIARARRRGIAEDVIIDARYLPLEDVGPLIRTGAVVVLPYRSATASGVLQVAYAFGRPVIVTDVGDLSSSVEPGETGIVVAVGDVQQLSRAIVKMLSDPSDLTRMGDAATHLAMERFSWSPIARDILDAYEGLA